MNWGKAYWIYIVFKNPHQGIKMGKVQEKERDNKGL